MKRDQPIISKNDEVQAAFRMMEHVFRRYRTTTTDESNRHHVGSPARVESDISEIDKAHLQLIRAKLDVAMSNKLNDMLNRASESSDKLGTKIFWLNVLIVLLTIAIAVAAVLELYQ